MSIKVVAINKKAGFLYTLLDKFEAGIELKGSEVKSLRAGRIQLKDSYVAFRKEEIYLYKTHISPYKPAALDNHAPERVRRLLLHRGEINKIFGSIQKEGLTCVPIRVYFKGGKAKVEIALAKGKKKWDKRQAEKKKSSKKYIKDRLRKNR